MKYWVTDGVVSERGRESDRRTDGQTARMDNEIDGGDEGEGGVELIQLTATIFLPLLLWNKLF